MREGSSFSVERDSHCIWTVRGGCRCVVSWKSEDRYSIEGELVGHEQC